MDHEVLKSDDIQRAGVGGLEIHRAGAPSSIGLSPAGSTDTPLIARCKARKPVLECRGNQVVAMFGQTQQKITGHVRTDRV
jgi:hypothetical protein